ncbi:hypothetical protein TNCV_4677741 [Trichonephila clavipes]|nr:hypothetical protein TNCV_4677741 [Trichonephila clavipes]
MPPNTLRVHTDLQAEIVEVEIEVVSPSIVPSGNFAELNRTVTCMVLKANDRRTSCPCHDEFRGPRSDYVRQSNNRSSGVAQSALLINPLLNDETFEEVEKKEIRESKDKRLKFLTRVELAEVGNTKLALGASRGGEQESGFGFQKL